jgi:murein DD-endopeptidase MepM/ murein hydrolase activator NlpD
VLTKAGAGGFLTAVILTVFTFGNVSAKSRVPHRTTKDQTTHRQSRVAYKIRKERPTGRQFLLAHKANKEHRAGRQTRIALKDRTKQKADRQQRIAQRTHKQQPTSERSRVAERTNADKTTRELPDEKQSSNQLVGAAQPSEPTISSASTNPVPQQKSAEPQTNPELESVVIPPAPVIVKRKANAIMIPTELGDSNSKGKSDLKSDSKPESKYEEHPAVASTVSVGSNFGYRRDPFTRRAKFHSGVDLKAHWGDAVGASQAGVVQFAGWHHGYGNIVIVDHGGGVTTQYAHLSSFDVEPGVHVERGTIIGRAGSTGRATSPHLHYEVRIDGTATDPLQPLALDPSSDYFKLSRPTVDAGRGSSTQTAGSSRDK